MSDRSDSDSGDDEPQKRKFENKKYEDESSVHLKKKRITNGDSFPPSTEKKEQTLDDDNTDDATDEFPKEIVQTDESPMTIVQTDELSFTSHSESKSTPVDVEVDVDATFFAKIMNVKDFCNVLVGIGNVPNLEHVLIQFDPDGMLLYCKPAGSPVLVESFWNKSLFQDYVCHGIVKKWVSKDRFEKLKTKISKDVEFIEITVLLKEASGFKFSGDRVYKTGGRCRFDFNVFQWAHNSDPNSLNFNFNWHVNTSSQKMKHNIQFIDDQSEFISLQLLNSSLIFEGVSDTGLVSERISHDTETNVIVDYQVLFYKRYLNIVTSVDGLHKSVKISFRMDAGGDAFPVLFSYGLDLAKPQSHFSVYIAPFINTKTN
jgi:hypothetical protein